MPYMPNAQIVRGLTGATGATGSTGAPGPAGTGSASITEAQLNANTSISDTSIVLDRTPPPGWVAAGTYVLIDAYTNQAELRRVTNIVSTTLTLDVALRYAHSAGDVVLNVVDDALYTKHFGCLGDSTTDDWAGLQRGIIETYFYGLWLDGQRKQHQFTQPLYMPSTHLRNIVLRCQASAFAPIDSNGAAVQNSQNSPTQFTASAATNVFTTPAGSGANVGNKVAFNAPSGETLPTGVTSGRVYYVKTTPTASTFTVSATFGGAELDITADGTGWSFTDVTTLARIFFKDVQIKGSTGNAGLNLLRVDLQQPAYTQDLRLDGQTGVGGTLFTLTGQISNHYNTEINVGAASQTGLRIGVRDEEVNHYSLGHAFFGLNMTGVNSSDLGIKLEHGQGVCFDNLWTESLATHMQMGDSGQDSFMAGINIGLWFSAGNATRLLNVQQRLCSYHIGAFTPYAVTASYIVDDVRGFTITGADTDADGQLLNFTQGPGSTIGPGPLSKTATLDFGSISAGASETLTITVTGALVGQNVVVQPTTVLPTDVGVVYDAWVSAANTVSLRATNLTASPINPASRVWRATILPPQK